jgi:hypothetical protein
MDPSAGDFRDFSIWKIIVHVPFTGVFEVGSEMPWRVAAQRGQFELVSMEVHFLLEWQSGVRTVCM